MRRLLVLVLAIAAAYVGLAYLVAPALWRHYEHAPGIEHSPKRTTTSAGIPGDPLNVALIGSEEALMAAFEAAGWRQPAPIDVRSSVGIAESVLLDRPDPTAPVSNLLLFGRKQDLAFEKEAGSSASKRHHVRFWHTDRLREGQPGFVGSASFDRAAGIDHLTGEFTHHIAPDIDAERDLVMADLARAGHLRETFQVTGIGPTVSGHNGGGDWYFTDGEMDVGVLTDPGTPPSAAPTQLSEPAAVRAKNRFFAWLRPWLNRLDEAE